MSVNVPTNSKQKEKDINQKLQYFGIYHAFKNGKLPSNKQCDIALNSALNSKALTSPPNELSSDGKTLVADLRNVIDAAKKMLLVKNEGELLQDFIWQAQKISGDNLGGKRPGLPVDKETGQQDASKAVDGLKTLGTLMITNGEFRKLLNDAMTLGKDIAADASQKAASRVRPSEEELSQIDQAAEENVWHEKPNVSKDDLKSRFKKNKGEKGRDASAGAAVAEEETGVSAQDKKKAYSDKTKKYLSEKIPKERREQTVWRLKKMIIEIQGHADYQQAIETLLTMAEQYAGHTKDVSKQGGSSARDVLKTDNVQAVQQNLRTLIERFANHTSLDSFFESLNTIYRDAEKDPELRNWFKNVDTLIRKSLREQGFIMEDECTRQWNELYDKGRYLLRERYRGHSDRIVDEVKFLANQFEQDPQNQALAESCQKLFKDLGQDTSGKATFKPDLLRDLRDVIIPNIFENVRYVPIPRIEVSDPMVDVVVENLVLEGDNLMPNVVEFGSDNYFRWGRKKITNKRDNKIMISMSGIQLDLRDINYYIKKKEGFPAITDRGVMDIFLGGEGLSVKLAASTAQKNDKENYFKLDKVHVSINNMDIKLRKSNHKLLFNTFKPMLFRVVKPALQKVVEGQVREAFKKGDLYVRDIHTEATRAQEAAREDPANAPSIFSRYADAIRARAQAKAKQAEGAAKRDTKVQTVMTLHDSIFPDIELPGAVSTKATEYADLAAKGERWECPIFSVGNASESTGIPSGGPITNKPHGATTNGAGAAGVASAAGVSGATAAAASGNGTKASDYQARGFSDEVDKAFVNGKSQKLGEAIKHGNGTNAADGVPNAPATTVTNGTTINNIGTTV
ncbi:unnamed protein product [Penicillium nalgiovense]|uniref:Uncharacterized protein n=1 Tax=Penicillium nalgiovense TaxID=60175 RepID=A0A9W4HC94_PENNA|nr:unnamed protein product [Penicillium nalgiovense]CAG7966073.1 unnamed protein product [Penicillium nalgiovense]CAG7982555.1 unnamed protein product [Penicillium nalgiovense]CAG7990802.1 unnamed protein product [Penicillium nalgiovense]CAG7991099.1 unnamed protein product [Penicillium nalgiovense]